MHILWSALSEQSLGNTEQLIREFRSHLKKWYWGSGIIEHSGANSELHTADGEYHNDCYKSFCCECNVKAAQSKELGDNNKQNIMLSCMSYKQCLKIPNMCETHD